MKGKRYLFIGLVFGIIMGWALGFLRFPYLEKNYSFLLGFVTALALVSLLLLLVTAWNRTFLPGLAGQETATGDAKSTHTFIWRTLLGILVLGGVAVGSTVYRQHESLQRHIQNQDEQLQEMAALVASVQKSELEPLLRSLLEDVGEELQRNPGRTLRDTTIARIAALSLAFRPHQYVEGDSLSKQAYSPERGQLLQALILMHIDSRAFARIKRNTLFSGADLRGSNLKGVDLSGIHLRGANLQDADLSGANLTGAELGEAKLWGACLNQANLSHADLQRADLRWAQLNEATLPSANLNGANLTNAQLSKADLHEATFQWAQVGGALFHEANLTGVDCVGTNFTKVNLSQADLSDADLRKTNLSEAVLVGTTFNKTLVDVNWLDKLTQWQPTGGQELRERYKVVNDTADKFKTPLYRLKKID